MGSIRGEFCGVSGSGSVSRTGRSVVVRVGFFDLTRALDHGLRPCVFRSGLVVCCVTSVVSSDGRSVEVFVPRSVFPSGCLEFSVGFPDGGPRGGSPAPTPVVAVFSRVSARGSSSSSSSWSGALSGSGWRDVTVASCSLDGPSSSALSGVVSSAFRECTGRSAGRRDLTSGSLCLPGGRGSFPVVKLFQAWNRVGAVGCWTLWVPRCVPLGSPTVGSALLAEWVSMGETTVGLDAASGVEGTTAGSGSAGSAVAAGLATDPPTAGPTGSVGPDFSELSRALARVFSSGVRCGATWTADPKSNNVWRDLCSQLQCDFSSSKDFITGSSGGSWSRVSGDCEDLSLLGISLFLESGVPASVSAAAAATGADLGDLEYLCLVACVVEKDGRLSESPPAGSLSSSRLTAHMCVGVKFSGSSVLFLVDTTSQSPVWKWAGRVYWATTAPLDGSRGTTLAFFSPGRSTSGGDTVCGQDIGPNGTVSVAPPPPPPPPANAGAPTVGGAPGPCAVDIATLPEGRALFSAAEAAGGGPGGPGGPGGSAADGSGGSGRWVLSVVQE